LDRIKGMNATVDVFKRDPEFDLERYSAQAFGSFFSEKEYGPVRWRFAPSAAVNARDFVFHPDQVMTEAEDGSLMVSFTASGWLEMAWYLIQWGDAVEVLEPLELKEMLDKVRSGGIEIWP
jgi:predicted DNA-binding transcriptional regulator YafY